MAERFLILLVDDEPDIAAVLNRAAAHSFPEAHFVYASSYTQAIDYLDGIKGRGPRLVLLDIDLQSQSTGFDFLASLRQHPKGCLIPVVILSSQSEVIKRREAFLRGANTYTLKPFSYADWQAYVAGLRTYWFQTVTVPDPYFHEYQ